MATERWGLPGGKSGSILAHSSSGIRRSRRTRSVRLFFIRRSPYAIRLPQNERQPPPTGIVKRVLLVRSEFRHCGYRSSEMLTALGRGRLANRGRSHRSSPRASSTMART